MTDLTSEAISQLQPSITLDTILELTEKLRDKRPKIYYGTSTLIKPGESVLIKATEYHPQFFACHPDDLEMIIAQLAPMNVIPLSEHRPVWPGLT